ncbi:MAG: hypothetical protein P4K94_00525 [Terracidiphilus sp.]|nr:hypothetical protein [Terracidiphilus sp.]
MQRRNFLKIGTAALAVSETAGSWLRAMAQNPTQENAGSALDSSVAAPLLDLTNAVLLTRPGKLPNAEQTASAVLVSEIAKRSGISLARSTEWPAHRPVIALASAAQASAWGRRTPQGLSSAALRPEGFRIRVENAPGQQPVVWVLGADPRGTLFGAGALLRRLRWTHGSLSIAADLDWTSSPAYAIRGHQLGYRPQANSYDGWDAAQFEQYIRELAFFGVNSIEGIPFDDDRKSPVMKFPRRQMNRAIGEICNRYGLDYWVWVPVDFDLNNGAKRKQLLSRCEEFFHDTPTLTGIFVPGGDPGDNPPELLFPFLEELAGSLAPIHPQAKIWPSLQQFSGEKVDSAFKYIRTHQPAWMGGLVSGPSSPPSNELRDRLPAQYRLRHYPDVSHNVRCQYEVSNWAQAFAMTEGRECVNPRAVEYARYFLAEAGYSDGFISYSDGVHDDVNKIVWSALSWDPSLTVTEILTEYAHVYFAPQVAPAVCDAILALERNWSGALLTNGSVEDTLLRWQQLERQMPGLAGNWRWQMCLLRANYDAFLRRRLAYETQLELEANARLLEAPSRGSSAAMDAARQTLGRAETNAAAAPLRARIVSLCDDLFHSIVLQTSVDKYFASGEERGAELDFIDLPLNNRWWLEDEFAKVAQLGSESARVERLRVLATWEHPGPGSFYDAVGDLDKSPRVLRYSYDPSIPGAQDDSGASFWWWDDGKSRARLTWQASSWPLAVVYDGIDPDAAYIVRSTGYRQALLRINGERVQPTLDGKKMGEFKEFPVPQDQVRKRRLTITWDPPVGEENLNWREGSRLSEVWLLRQPAPPEQRG